jgi:hypothetical protein
MKARYFGLALAALALIGLLAQSGDTSKAPPTKPKLAVSIKPQNVADALRVVILTDRELYTRITAPYRQASDLDRGSNATRQAQADLPSPCELLRLSSQTVASKGVEYSYVLRSFQPLNARNAPETEVERKGLQFVATRPDLTYSSEELLGGRWYFTAVYPDVALNQSCIACHPRANEATGKEHQIGDVLGALVIRLALEL